MGNKPSNSKEKDNLKESGEHLDASNVKEMKNIEEKMQKLEMEKNQKMESQMESEKCNETKDNDVFVPKWLIESLASVTRIEMAQSTLSYSSRTFQRLCWRKLHGNVEPHMVGSSMELDEERDLQSDNFRAIVRYGGRGQSLPIPSTAPPDYIIGFKRINVYFLDDRVLEFIKCIAPKLDGIQFVLRMDFCEWKLDEQDERTEALHCLLNALDGRIGYFRFMWRINFKNFNRHFSQFINQCQCISIYDLSPKFQKPEFDILFEWLTNRQQMDGGKQKVLEFIPNVKFDYFYERIKDEFSNSTKPLNFLILFDTALPEYDVILENENTSEVLISSWSGLLNGKLILRCPIGQEEQWKKEGEEKMYIFTSYDVTSISMDIRHFGTFTNLAKNEQKQCGKKCEKQGGEKCALL